MQKFKLGLKAPSHKPILWFSDYFSADALPTPPATFDYRTLVKKPWQMLDNDKWGCCVFSGGGHLAMLWTAMGGKQVRVSDLDVQEDYTAVTGFNPNDPSSDNGTDMMVAAKYWHDTGIRDADGNRHKVDAYIAIQPGNINELKLAAWLFGGVGIGILVGARQEQQFESGEAWNFDVSDKPDGGHFVPVMGWNTDGTIPIVTWGGEARMTQKFYQRRCDQAIAYLDFEMLDAKGLSKSGFDRDQLIRDLALLPKG